MFLHQRHPRRRGTRWDKVGLGRHEALLGRNDGFLYHFSFVLWSSFIGFAWASLGLTFAILGWTQNYRVLLGLPSAIKCK